MLYAVRAFAIQKSFFKTPMFLHEITIFRNIFSTYLHKNFTKDQSFLLIVMICNFMENSAQQIWKARFCIVEAHGGRGFPPSYREGVEKRRILMKIHEKTLYVQGFPINRGIKSRLENSLRFHIVDKKMTKSILAK